MPALVAFVPATVMLLAGPALAQQEDGNPADTGFPIVLLVLAVVATVFALVWRAISKRRQNQRR